MALVSNPKSGDDVSVRQAIAKLGSTKLGPTSTPTYAGLTLTGLTINSLVYPVVADDGTSTGALTSLGAAIDGQLPIGDTGGVPVLATLTGTANEIDITNGAGTITIGLVNPLIVAKGGTGAATLTDHGILLGSGTSAVTPLGVASNGQLPIGSAGADPVLATLTGTAKRVTVTNGAGTITLSGPQDIDTVDSPTFAGLTVVNAITEFSTDGTMGGDSDSAVPTEKATKLYTDTLRADLASTANAKGASLIGVEDSATQFDATDVEAALSELMVLVTPVEYNPTMTRTAGGDAGGDDDSVATIDDADSYDTDELSATPGFDIQAVFSGVADFNQVQIHTAYDGNPAHVVRIDLDKTPFDWSSYDTILADIDDNSGNFIFNAITVASAAQYINSGEVRLRFYHSSAGNATHDFFIDYCALWKTGVSVGVTEHGGLTGLDDVSDHPSYLLLDGTRALAGAWDMGNQVLTNVNIDSGVITGITDLAIADGGTGQSTAQLAINALSAVSGATNEHVLTKDTGTGNAVFKAAGAPAAHTHDGDTLQLDGINSDGGAFPITTSGVIVINAGVNQVRMNPTVSSGTNAVLKTGNVTTSLSWCAFRAGGIGANLSQIQALNTAASSSTAGGGVIVSSDDGAAIASGHRLGYFLFNGSISAAATANGGGIVGYADGNWADGTSYPTQFSFEVCAAGATTRTERLTIKSTGYIGISEVDPVSLLEMTSVGPILTLHNSTHGDTDGGRISKISFRGEQSGGEETLLAQLEAFHHGVADDQKGAFQWRTNDGSDGTSPTFRMKLDSSGLLGLNTNTPYHLFHLKTSSDGGGICIQRNSVAAGSYADLKFLMSTSDSTAPVSWIRCYRRTGVSDIDMHFAVGGNDALVLDDDLSVTGYGIAAFEGASVTVGKASTTTGTLVLHDSNSANTVTLTVPDISAGSLSFTLPPTDGDNTNVLQTDGNGVLTWAAAGGGVAAHAILDGSVHTDSVADAVTRGSIIYGNATPKWDELVVGGANTFLGSDGIDVSYRTAAQVMASLSGAATAAFDLNGQNLTNVGTLGAGNTTITGTLDVTGNIDPTSYETTRGGFKDEDLMGSDSATVVCSQQSIKAFAQFNDAGDIAGSHDYDLTDFTTDGTWRDWDLSGEVPAGAKEVTILYYIADDAIGSQWEVRENGNSNEYNTDGVVTQVANISVYGHFHCALDANRVIEYRATNLTWSSAFFTIRSWRF